MTTFSSYNRKVIYKPETFGAWVTAHDFPNGDLGLSFTEITKAENPAYKEPSIEFAEAVGAPVSYCSAECDCKDVRSERVYMVSKDSGETFSETGRCDLAIGSFLNMGFENGRIVGLNVAKENEAGNGWSDFISVKESTDGGSTWKEKCKLLEGCAVYLWRVRRLTDGSFIIMASLYGTPWGEGRERATRNTMLPGETYVSKIQTFFLHTKDGESYDGPHYVLPGIGAHEYDMAELSNGDLLFIAGDVQATPVGRQIVKRLGSSFINGPLLPIRKGAPAEPNTNPQGGFVPEAFICLPGDVLFGCRRNKCFSVSGDLGENWYSISGNETGLYQPVMISNADGKPLVFGHIGGDTALGQAQMNICCDQITLKGEAAIGCKLTLSRNLAPDKSHYINSYTAVLTSGGKPVSGQKIKFRIVVYWNMDGTVCSLTQDEAPIIITAETDCRGCAVAALPDFDDIRDIHHAYNVDAVFISSEETLESCVSPMITSLSMRPYRHCSHPYPAYFAEDTLYISPALEKAYPGIYEALEGASHDKPVELTDKSLLNALVLAKVIGKDKDGTFRWIRNVHGTGPIKTASQGDGDQYK